MPPKRSSSSDLDDSNVESIYSNSNSNSSSGKSRDRIARCIRQVANMSHVKPTMLMDTKSFNPQLLELSIPRASPKLKALFDKIAALDEQDMKKHKKHFKHMIFTDISSSNYGAKLIASAFVSSGFTPAFTNALGLKPDEKLLETKGNNFGLLLSKTYGKKSMSTKFKKAQMHKYNERPSNTNGDLIRFIILDQGFKEGIDLFDVKYVHLFEPLISNADQKQAIGRGTRFCGQKGLEFHPRFGWPLYVFRYDVKLKHTIEDSKTLFELFIKYSDVDLRKVIFASEVEDVVIDASVDHQLTKEIHSFAVENPSPILKGGAPKKVVKKKEVKKKEVDTQSPKKLQAPTKIMGHNEMQDYISTNFKKFSYPKAKLENLCDTPQPKSPSATSKVTFTPTQDFVRHYFRPESAYKGILLFHSVGSGKTCTAIATATSSFEREGYTILWVTRHTLKADIWKNMYQQICHTVIQDKIDNGALKLPKKISGPMRYLSDNWIEPISYKQFSNMLLKENKYYTDIEKRNGSQDPLKKTLVIIDEAHKLYAPNVVGSEKPNTDILEELIQNSYKVSGKDSVRVMLMTATPYTEDPMEMMKLLNILRPASKSLPTEFDDFSKKYLNIQGYFTESGRKRFQDEVAGYISYINRSQDGRYFSHPIIENVMVDISTAGKPVADKHEDLKVKEKIAAIKELREHVKVAKADVKAAKADNKAKCKEDAKAILEKCKASVKDKYDTGADNAKAKKDSAMEKCKSVAKDQKAACKDHAASAYKATMDNLKAQKAKGMAGCKDSQKACNLSNNPVVKESTSRLEELLKEIADHKAEKDGIKNKLKGVRIDNKERMMKAKEIRQEMKGLRQEKNSLADQSKSLQKQIKKATEDVQKAKLTSQLKELRKSIKEVNNQIQDNRAKINTLTVAKKIAQIEVGKSTLGDNSQEAALEKRCLS